MPTASSRLEFPAARPDRADRRTAAEKPAAPQKLLRDLAEML